VRGVFPLPPQPPGAWVQPSAVLAHRTAEGFGRGLSVGCGRWQVETVKREAPRVSDKVVNEHVPVLQKKVRSLHHWPRAGPSSREHQQTHV
jgi:hypothetical protein